MNENRIGRFLLSQVSVNWRELLPVMGNFVVLDARYRADWAAVEYLALSPLFEDWSPNAEAPFYRLEISFPPFPGELASVQAFRVDKPVCSHL